MVTSRRGSSGIHVAGMTLLDVDVTHKGAARSAAVPHRALRSFGPAGAAVRVCALLWHQLHDDRIGRMMGPVHEALVTELAEAPVESGGSAAEAVGAVVPTAQAMATAAIVVVIRRR